ncbi:hypothetical protein BJV82DRAFT_233935 [Fennellomyces sp. T-0311]|nr:hypothetical protein BJV82DRAFT_233935 [Fennellomyces sp. T-0311]
MCPDLQSLTCFGPTDGPFSFERFFGGNPRHSSATILPRVPNLGLTRLVLSHSIPDSPLAELLKKSPGLTSLKLYWESWELPRVVDTILKHCPRLQSFAYGIQGLRTSIPWPLDNGFSGNGLQNLILAADVPGRTETQWELFKQLGLLFHHCRATLRALKLAGTLLSAADYHILTLLEHQGLQAIEFKVPWDEDGSRRLSALIAANPSLRTVCISGPSMLWNDTIMTRLGSLTQLQRISIHIKGNSAHQQQHMSRHSIRSLFNHSLQDLTIRISKRLPVSMRDELATEISDQCYEIQRLDIRGIIMSESALLEVLRNLKNSKVRQLILSSHRWPDGIEGGIMDTLAAIPHLSYLKIIDQRQMFRKCSLQYILRASASSRFLAVSLCHGNRILTGCKPSDVDMQQGKTEDNEPHGICYRVDRSDSCSVSASSADEEDVDLGQHMGSYLFANLFPSIIN